MPWNASRIRILNNFKVAGFAVAVVDKDQVLYAKGFGYRDLENEVKADANTLFAIGSCSKAFTSSMLGILRKEDKVDFDESPITYLPKLRFYNDELNNFVTVKDLMCHRTGLTRIGIHMNDADKNKAKYSDERKIL